MVLYADRRSHMPVVALQSFIPVLLQHIPEDSSPRILVKPDIPAPSPVRPNDHGAKRGGAAYGPTVVYVLELATILATRDADTVRELGKDVADTLQSVIRQAKHVHPAVVSRALYYLLSLLKASNVSLQIERKRARG